MDTERCLFYFTMANGNETNCNKNSFFAISALFWPVRQSMKAVEPHLTLSGPGRGAKLAPLHYISLAMQWGNINPQIQKFSSFYLNISGMPSWILHTILHKLRHLEWCIIIKVPRLRQSVFVASMDL